MSTTVESVRFLVQSMPHHGYTHLCVLLNSHLRSTKGLTKCTKWWQTEGTCRRCIRRCVYRLMSSRHVCLLFSVLTKKKKTPCSNTEAAFSRDVYSNCIVFQSIFFTSILYQIYCTYLLEKNILAQQLHYRKADFRTVLQGS